MSHISETMREMLDLYGRQIAVVAIVILVGTGSFGLGRLSAGNYTKEPIAIEYPASNTASALLALPEKALSQTIEKSNEKPAVSTKPNVQTAAVGGALQPGGTIVASKTGTKYYFPWCGTVKRIKEENKVWFDSVEEARKAGYEPAANCKGLK